MLTVQDFPETPFTPAMLRGIGISRKALEVAVHNRDVRRVLRGVYVRSDAPDTIESRVAAARLVTSEHSVICDRTAAWIHGIDVFAWHETEVLPPIESYVLRHHASTASRRRGGRQSRPARVRRDGGGRCPGHHACADSRRSRLASCRRVTAWLRSTPSCVSSGSVAGTCVGCSSATFGGAAYGQARPLRWRSARPHGPSRPASRGRDTRSSTQRPSGAAATTLDRDRRRSRRFGSTLPTRGTGSRSSTTGRSFHSRDADRQHDSRRRTWLRQHGWIVIVVDRDSFTASAVDAWIR